jgi:glycine cleavage system H protein
MTTINGCEIPDDLFYMIDKHVWAKKLENGNLRVGMTSAAVHLAGGKFTAVTPKRKAVGQELAQGKSIAIVESSKFVGPVPAPVTGIIININDAVAQNPELVAQYPYDQGWVAEIQPTKWEDEKQGLASGPKGIKAYQAHLEQQGVNCAA